jgi:hypothetical protein
VKIKEKQEEEHLDAEGELIGQGHLIGRAFHFDVDGMVDGGKFGMICASIYDSKPVTMLTTAHHQIVFKRKSRQVWDHEVKKMKELFYWRLDMIDTYNHKMNGVDLQDQYRWYYRIDGKRMWRWRRWTWAVYRWVIDTRCVNGYILHTMLVDIAIAQWTEVYVQETQRLMTTGSSTRSAPLSSQDIEGLATEKCENTFGHSKPKKMSQKDFRIGVVEGLFGVNTGTKRGRPSSSSSSSSKKKKNVGVGERARLAKQKEMMNNGFSTPGFQRHQYPKNSMNKNGREGMKPDRLGIAELKLHRPYSFVDSKAKKEDNNHRCMICTRIGKIFKHATKNEMGFRGGVSRPRRASIMCISELCPKNYCSCECFNVWHVGSEFP